MNSGISIDSPAQSFLGAVWLPTLILLAACFAVLLGLYWPTVASAVHLWSTSSSYNYGFLIAPISFYLVWIDRDVLRQMIPQRSLLGLLIILGFGFVWLAGDLMGINEGRHIAFVGLMQGIFLFVLGWPIYRRFAFALFYLWLMVPTGEFLIEPLQHVSRDGAVLLLKAFSIPVFVEGWTIEVPMGTFVVERGCSGLNFILASLALALLFGKLTYRRWSLRISCVVMSLVVAVVANILRVFLIVAITQWSERRINIADDHLFYGWVFFGVIMVICMWFGMRYAENAEKEKPNTDTPSQSKPRFLEMVAGAAVLCAVLAAFPIYASSTEHVEGNSTSIVNLPPEVGSWRLIEERSPKWSPGFAESDDSLQRAYVSGDSRIEVAVAYCAAQWSGCETASSDNKPVHADTPGSSQFVSSPVQVSISGHPTQVLETKLVGRDARLVLTWYDSAGCVTASRLQSKICVARQRLLGRIAAGGFVAISADASGDFEASQSALIDFAAKWPGLAPLVRTIQH